MRYIAAVNGACENPYFSPCAVAKHVVFHETKCFQKQDFVHLELLRLGTTAFGPILYVADA